MGKRKEEKERKKGLRKTTSSTRPMEEESSCRGKDQRTELPGALREPGHLIPSPALREQARWGARS